jgi:hypothetical protein
VRLRPVDYRLPTLDDSAALGIILSAYRPVLSERGYLLFERVAAAAEPPDHGRIVQQEIIRFNDVTTLGDDPDAFLTLTLEFDYTRRGQVRRALYRVPPLFLEATLNNGEFRRFRLTPGLTRTEFLLNPLCENESDLAKLYVGENAKRVASFRIVTDEAGRETFERQIRLTVRQHRPWTDAGNQRQAIRRLIYPMMLTPPDRVESRLDVRVEEEAGRSVLVVHPEGRMTYDIPEGARTIRGQFGLMKHAYEAGTTDGVDFLIEHETLAGEREVLFARRLAPRNDPADRGPQEFAVTLPKDARGRLHLRTTNLLSDSLAFDWSYWAAVELR